MLSHLLRLRLDESRLSREKAGFVRLQRDTVRLLLFLFPNFKLEYKNHTISHKYTLHTTVKNDKIELVVHKKIGKSLWKKMGFIILRLFF